ncbi:hypothetical protein GCM10022223_11450 [Kineosporia mesophila]|uniref:Glycosyltransferase RgtA/B/C/D-like domain-containing protein n=1 Tax=Kineosporia mesophila TaxID=566012 RepID=A0ABP6Z4F5_9ACTN|nr:hypothetical protein [Kineosporia mesophila]MCD5352622.1 hypothetical protein [Kineosporia mesophila]
MPLSSDIPLLTPVGAGLQPDPLQAPPPGGLRHGSRVHRPGGGGPWAELILGRHYLGLIMGLATTGVLTWGLGRSALWLDESASVMATQRSWSHLWTLGQGAETPLLPYYVLLKLFTGGARILVPALQNHPEVLYRLPSVIVTVLAGWVLTAWLSRVAPPRLVVACGAMLLLTTGFSRFGQEARPYAAVLFLAVVVTVLWSVMAHDTRWRWSVGYALGVAAMISLHTLSAGLLAAHLVATLVCRPQRSLLLRTTMAGTLGVALASPLILTTAGNGTGPLYIYPDVTPRYTLGLFVRLFTNDQSPLLLVGPVLLLALVGLVQVLPGPFTFVARLAACWALVPLIAMVPVLLVHPNLLVGRYALFVVPAWALLAGLGVVTLADRARALLTDRPRAATALATAVTVALIGGTTALEAHSQTGIRTAAGHREDIRPALALAARPQYADLRIVVNSRNGAVEVGVYGRALEKRLVMQRVQREGPAIWPDPVPAEDVKKVLREKNQLILLQRYAIEPGCDQTATPVPAAEIDLCEPKLLKNFGFHVQKIEPAGDGWVFALMRKDRR